MRNIIKQVIICMMLLSVAGAATAAGFADETLRYVIGYKWGLIQKDAGEATLTLRNSGEDYRITLTARTKPWADKIFRVRDTLTATVARNGFRPRSYVKAAHEDGRYSLDRLAYSRPGGNVTLAEATRLRQKEGKSVTTRKTFSASGEAFDMLSIFYYIRAIDFAAMKPGEQIRTTVFSGSQSETVTITFEGREQITLRDKSKRSAFKITFRFTTAGRKKSSDDMTAWISADQQKIALRLVGHLPLGQVRVDLD